MNWQPIETAPKGPQVLVYDEGAIVIAQWVPGGWWDHDLMHPPPTHWMPLPAAPGSERPDLLRSLVEELKARSAADHRMATTRPARSKQRSVLNATGDTFELCATKLEAALRASGALT